MRAAGLIRPALLAWLAMATAAHCGGDTRSRDQLAEVSIDGSADSPPADAALADHGPNGDSDAPDVAPEECEPAEVEPCYDGPTWTTGVGACRAGERTCGPGGHFGTCVGQVLPAEESCGTPLDDDCDGLVNEGGKDCGCSAGTSVSCYQGSSQTLGVGACKAGSQACLAGGVGYGPCNGSVLPGKEDCAKPGDEDCDAAPDCPGDVQWAYAYDAWYLVHAARAGGGSLGMLTYQPMTWWELDPAGSFSLIQTHITNVYTEHGPHALGGDPTGASQLVVGTYDKVSPWAPLLPSDVSGLFVMSRNAWQRGFAVEGAGVGVEHVALHPTETPAGWYLGGSLNGSLEAVPGQPFSGTGGPFVMRVTATSGDATFARRVFETVPGAMPPAAELEGLQAIGQGAALVGTFASSVSLDGTVMTSKGDRDVFLATLSSSGKTTAAFSFGGASEERACLVGRAGTGPIVVAGIADGMTIGTLKFPSGAYLLRFSDALKPVNALTLPECSLVVAGALDEATEDAYLVLVCKSATDFGGGAIPAGVVLLSVDKDNQHRFSRSLPAGAAVEHVLAFDGALHLAGTFTGTPDFGTGVLAGKYPGQTQIFAVRMTK